MGVFAHAMSLALEQSGRTSAIAQQVRPGLAAWLVALLRRRAHREPRLALVERISLAPRQIVALVEADGQRLLVATSPEGAAVFFPLNPAIPDSTTTQESQADAEGTSL